MKTLLLLALFPVLAGAADLSTKSNDELCVAGAITTITGDVYHDAPFHSFTQVQLQQALDAKGGSCDPWEKYMAAAEYRLQEQRERRQRIANAIQAVGQQMSRPTQSQPPVQMIRPMQQTQCHLVGNTVNCDSW